MFITKKKTSLKKDAFFFSSKTKRLSELRLGLLETEATVAFLPLSALQEKVDALEALQDVAPGGDFTGPFKRCVLAHFSKFLSTKK